VLLLGDVLELDGAPWACCPRYFLRRALAALHAEFGLTVRAGFGQRFVVPGGAGDAGRTLRALRGQAPLLGRLLAAMRANGIVPDCMQPGDAPGEFEVAAAAAVGIAAADQAVVVRELIEAFAADDGVRLGRVRIGVALVDGFGHSAMADPSGEHGLSDEAEHWAAGVVHHLPALAAVVAPWAGMYPSGRSRAELSVEGRPGALRLRSDAGDDGVGVPARIELDYGDAGASPYLALGALVWAGLDGLRQHRRLFEQSPEALPGSLADALDIFQESVFAAEWFGMEFREQFLRYGRAESARSTTPTMVTQTSA
jgi:glutamine synthetase